MLCGDFYLKGMIYGSLCTFNIWSLRTEHEHGIQCTDDIIIASNEPIIKYFPFEFNIDGINKDTKCIAPLTSPTPTDKNMIMYQLGESA